MTLKDHVRELVTGFTAEDYTDLVSRGDMGYLLRRLCDSERYGSQTALAAEIGVSVQYINDIMRGKCDPGPTVLQALGVEKCLMYHLERAA